MRSHPSYSKEIKKTGSADSASPLENTSFFERLLDTFTDNAVLVIDSSLFIIYHNKAFEHFLCNHNMDEHLLGTRLTSAYSFINDSVIAKIEDAFYLGKPVNTELASRCEKQNLHLELGLTPFVLDDGQLYLAINIKDVTLWYDTQKTIVQNEARYKLLLENQGEGVGILDSLCRFSYVNKAGGEIFGCNTVDLLGKPVTGFLNALNKTKFEKKVGNGNQYHIPPFELQITLKNGQKKHLMVTLTHGDLETSDHFIVFRDITEKKESDRKLRHSEQKLKHLNATKDKFFSIIAHDLKNPFGSIMGFSNLILRKLHQNSYDKIQQYAEIILKASANGFKLLENLLEWSNSQNGSLKVSPSKVDLDELVHYNFDICSINAEKKSINLHTELEPECMVYVDEDMINTVLRNLITNAIKFTPEGKSIYISSKSVSTGMVEVSIRDEGVGIEGDDLKKLFKIQHSFSTRGTNGEEGTGLGLILCKEFVDQNGGKIWVESEPDNGATFRFTLPKA